MSQGIILYGPPASGKDTITQALWELNPRYGLFLKLKVGPGRNSGYRTTSAEHLAQLRQENEVVWENTRYNATYIIDRTTLHTALRVGVPVVHLGQVLGIDAVRQASPNATWLSVSLWCPRDIAATRLVERGTTDLEERLRAWDDTIPPPSPDLVIDTSITTARDTAARIDAAASRTPGPPNN